MLDRFSLVSLQKQTTLRSNTAKAAFAALQKTEARVRELVRLFYSAGYFSVAELQKRLMSQRLPDAKLESMALFLLGYICAESSESDFDVELFGEMSSITSVPKGEIALSCLQAIFALLNETELVELPNRGSMSKPKKLAKKKKFPKKASKK